MDSETLNEHVESGLCIGSGIQNVCCIIQPPDDNASALSNFFIKLNKNEYEWFRLQTLTKQTQTHRWTDIQSAANNNKDI